MDGELVFLQKTLMVITVFVLFGFGMHHCGKRSVDGVNEYESAQKFQVVGGMNYTGSGMVQKRIECTGCVTVTGNWGSGIKCFPQSDCTSLKPIDFIVYPKKICE